MDNQNNPQGVEPRSSIIKSSLEYLEIEVPSMFQTDLFFLTEVNTLVNSVSHENGRYHLVKVELIISTTTEENTSVFKLSMVYSAVVVVEGDCITDDKLNEILYVDVPQRLLDNIRAIVWQTTRESGFPVMLKDDVFGRPTHSDNEDQVYKPLASMPKKEPDSEKEKDQVFVPLPSFINDEFDIEDGEEEDVSAPEDYSLSFRSVIEGFNSFEEGAEFLRTFNRALNTDILGYNSFDQLPTFQSYYRFITPIPYHCPEIDDCDPELWPMLFRLLFGSTKADCKIVDGTNNLPELVFNYDNYRDYRVSELDFINLNDLLSDLMTEALCEVSVKLLNRSTKASERKLNWMEGQLITKEQFYRLHNFFPDMSPEEDRVFFEKLYSKIKECDIQTYLYRL